MQKAPIDAAINGAKSAIPSPHFVKVCLNRARPTSDPAKALENATRLSSAIAAAVLSPSVPSHSLHAKWEREGTRHRFIFVPVAVALPILLLVFALASGHPTLSIAGVPIFLAVLGADSHYYFDRQEASWFAIAI